MILNLNSYKCIKKLNRLVEGDKGAGTAFVYSNLVKAGGMELFAECLRQNGYLDYQENKKNYDIKDETIDYKTGKENYKSHSRQLYNYQDALENLGYTAIRKLLVYIDEEQVVEVN